MAETNRRQHEFVAELVDRGDQVFGLRLTANKFLVLFFKCLYIRKRKKIVTLLELLVPVLIFYYAIQMVENVFKLSEWAPTVPSSRTIGDGDGFLFGPPKRDYRDLIFYDYNTSNVIGPGLDSFLKAAFSSDRFR